MAMEMEAPISLAHRPSIPQTAATILCCQCGAPIDGTTSADALCADCLRLSVDISSAIPREATIHTCRDCERWLQPPAHWLTAAPESRELLALCLRKLRGLNKVRIIDASFIWTEPHSRRVKVKITVQQESLLGTIIQQTFVVEYVVAYHQCPDCAKSFTANTWRSVVQIRQKVPHKRTFLYLEQLILKHSTHRDTINIREATNGLDFFFSTRNHAEKFVDFLSSVTPLRVKKSQELISQDIHTSSKSYKFTFSCEIVPICKDDLVALPLKLAKQIGNIPPLTICSRVGTSITVLDPATMQTSDISPAVYWREPFSSLADVTSLTEFIVLEIEPTVSRASNPPSGRYIQAEATIARASDLGVNSTTYFVRTHLGGILHAGDSALGYHLSGTNFNNAHLEAIESSSTYSQTIPDVVLIKKHYPRSSKSASKRKWKLKRMMKPNEQSQSSAGGEGRQGGGGKGRRQQDEGKLERDFEMFLRDVEEDEEVRQGVALYKAQKEREQRKRKERKAKGDNEMDVDDDGGSIAPMEEEGTEADDEVPRIEMDELLEDFDELDVGGDDDDDDVDEHV